jgi:hypothetical protein
MTITLNVDFAWNNQYVPQKCGILTSSPSYDLDVQGDLHVSQSFMQNSNTIYVWDTSDSINLYTLSNVSLFTDTNSHTLDVNGTIRAQSFINSSDQTLKYDISPETLGTDFITTLRSKKFIINNHYHHGFIAQDILEADENSDFVMKNGEYYSLDMIGLLSPIVKCIQELDNKYTELLNV